MTGLIEFANNAQSNLAAPLSPSSVSLSVTTGTGGLFPSPTGGDYFVLTLLDALTKLVTEIIHVTARSGDTMTVVRAQEGTTAESWLAGDLATNECTAGTMQQFPQFPLFGIHAGQESTNAGGNVSATAGFTAPSKGIIIVNGNVASGGGVISTIAVTYSGATGDAAVGANFINTPSVGGLGVITSSATVPGGAGTAVSITASATITGGSQSNIVFIATFIPSQ